MRCNFTLIICTYMRSDALLKLLKSLENQILYPNDIIIVDGSTNNETQIMLENNKFKALRYFKVLEADRGLTRQRNFGIRKINEKTEIVCFLDDDIILYKQYFQELLSTYKIYPQALAVGGYIINEVQWKKIDRKPKKNEFEYDGYVRKDSARFILRKKLGLIDGTKPGFMPVFSHGRSVGFLPPSGKIYEIEQIMGGVSSYKKEVFDTITFSNYFEGYGLYEDADFSLRLAQIGKLYLNTNAKLEHHHNSEGRPNKFKYGKMVLRNGWYVWRVKNPNPTLKARFKWNAILMLLTIVRITNIINTNKPKEAFSESLGRIVGWWSLIFNKPKIN